MSTTRMTVLWSWRDLRKRWRLVVALAVAIAIGTGIFAALQSMTTWRTESNDRSFEALAMHDLEVRLGDGLFADRGVLLDILASIPDAGLVRAAEERLVVPVQIDASTSAQTILVSGELVGMAETPAVDEVHVFAGVGLDQGAAVLDVNFARFHDLPDEGTVVVGGGGPLHYSGVGTGPEYLYITGGERGGLFAHASYAVLFVPIDEVWDLTGRHAAVNDLVLTLEPEADRDAVQQQLESALATALPGLDPGVTTRDDDPVYSTLYEDIGNDQQVYTIVAVLVLAGAAIATFNLITRIVESQRREIGIGMALGATPWLLATRPLLVGVQIALLGTVLGLGLGYLAMAALAGVLADIVPLPIWVTDLEARAFLIAAVPGVVLPVVASALPVWRAVRIEPVVAIQTGYLTAREAGYAHLGRWIRMPGRSSYWEMPIRNILRTPRRTILTGLGIGTAIATLVAILGLLDTFTGTLAASETELTREAPDRMVIVLDTFHPVGSPLLAAIEDDPSVGRAEPGLQLGGTVPGDPEEIELVIELLSLEDAMWIPTLTGDIGPSDEPSIVLSTKAASDLGVAAGDTVALQHLTLDPSGTGRATTTTLLVRAIHPSAARFQAYMDLADAPVFGMSALRNQVTVDPAPGISQAEVQQSLFGMPGVVSVQPVDQLVRVLEDAVDQFVDILRVVEIAVLLLAFLIAVNSTSITVDERSREHATMFAFGLRLRTVVGMITVESSATGIVGTVAGLAAGSAVMLWIVERLLPRTVPEFGLDPQIGAATIVTAAALGIVAVSAAPLLTIRRLSHMDIPSTLRVVE